MQDSGSRLSSKFPLAKACNAKTITIAGFGYRREVLKEVFLLPSSGMYCESEMRLL